MKSNHSGLRSAAVFALCGLFAVLAMGLALLSSGVYRSTVSDSDQNYIRRTSMSYLLNQVRRADMAGGVSVGTFGGSDALMLMESVGEDSYVTLLYCYDGSLRELYTELGTDIAPEDGVAVLELSSLSLSVDGATITITATALDGDCSTASIAPRTGIQEVAF